MQAYPGQSQSLKVPTVIPDGVLAHGVLAHGFVRMRCNDCGKSFVVGFSSKGREFCPSCTERRMADTSARLVDDTFPENAPVVSGCQARLARTFNLQMEICTHCGGRMRMVAAITDGASMIYSTIFNVFFLG